MLKEIGQIKYLNRKRQQLYIKTKYLTLKY